MKKLLPKRIQTEAPPIRTLGPAVLYQGDCLEILKSLPDNSVDAIVTDPPAGIGFMGKEWDSSKGGRENWVAWMTEVMQQCRRVLKPGGHVLIWAIPRTAHWTATACENAGFEIRDKIYHLFGTGFPKSMDVSKAIDKAAGAVHPVVGRKRTRELPNDVPFGQGLITSHADEITGRRTGEQIEIDITAPATSEAKQWQGWGTALKPAAEEWILCRKPLEGTVAENVLRYGTGALNIDACRIETSENLNGGAYAKVGCRGISPSLAHNSGMNRPGKTAERPFKQPAGRWPANVIHDGSAEVLKHFPDQQPARKGRVGKRGGCGFGFFDDQKSAQAIGRWPADPGGSAARFFYCTKANRTDRNEGCSCPNKHPTLKSTRLMRYLCRLITPPEGIILDPFAGSFSTGKAAVQEGFRFIGIEQDPEYFDIGCQRIRYVLGQTHRCDGH